MGYNTANYSWRNSVRNVAIFFLITHVKFYSQNMFTFGDMIENVSIYGKLICAVKYTALKYLIKAIL